MHLPILEHQRMFAFPEQFQWMHHLLSPPTDAGCYSLLHFLRRCCQYQHFRRQGH